MRIALIALRTMKIFAQIRERNLVYPCVYRKTRSYAGYDREDDEAYSDFLDSIYIDYATGNNGRNARPWGREIIESCVWRTITLHPFRVRVKNKKEVEIA